MRQHLSTPQPSYFYQLTEIFTRRLSLAGDMSFSALPHGWSINMPKTLPTLRQQEPETTPSKRRAPSMIHQIPSDARIYRTPNLTRAEKPTVEFLGTPDLPVPRKRAKSAAGQSPGADATNGDNTSISSGLQTIKLCNKKWDCYKNEVWQSKHTRKCADPTCQVRSASLQRRSPNDNDKLLSRVPEQRAEDFFTSKPTSRQVASLWTASCADVLPDNESPPSEARGELNAGKFETIGESHRGIPRSEEADYQETEDLDEAHSDQDESILDNAGSTYDKSPLEMHSELRAKFEQGISSSDEPGHIYVMRDVNRPHLCKIGRSKDTKVRLKTIERKCGLDLELVHYKRVSFYTKTEALVHAYLLDLCKPYKCKTCKQKHDEWFEIPSDLAKAAVDKWVNFMRHESPYDSKSKTLRSCWSRWLNLHEFTFADSDVDGMRRQWDKFMSRSELDHLSFQFQSVWDIVWRFFWPVYATFAWTATFIAFRHPIVFFLMAMSVIGTFVSMSHDFHLPRRAVTTPNKRRTK